MDENQVLVPNRAMSLAIADTGVLVARTSISLTPIRLDGDLISVVTAFFGGASLSEAHSTLTRTWDLEREEFHRAVSSLVSAGILVGREGADHARSQDGFGSVFAHHLMLRDAQRVAAYRRAIERYAAGKRVLEIGCGTGVLSLFAAKAGALSVNAVEETGIADLAAEVLRDNGADAVTLHRGNSRNITLPVRADLVIHELIGFDPFDENMLLTLDDARRRLTEPGARFLPARFEVWCVGVDLQELAIHRRKVLEEIDAYGAHYGLDLSAMRRLVAQLPATRFRRATDSGNRPRVVTTPCRVIHVDFEKDELAKARPLETIEMTLLEDCAINGLWIYFRAMFDHEIILSTAPTAPLTHWQPDFRVVDPPIEKKAGETIRLCAHLRDVEGRQRLMVEPRNDPQPPRGAL